MTETHRGRPLFLLAVAAVAALLLAGCLGAGDGDGELTREEKHDRIMTMAEDVAADLDTPSEAKAAGYVPDKHCIPGMGVHYIHKPGQNDSYIDTTLDLDHPEVVVFEPQNANLSDTSDHEFRAIEYLVVTEGTDMNSTETKPRVMGVPMDGPMPGHTPNMPWHVDFHVYLADGYESGPDFPPDQPEKITCPEGTTPPGGE